MSKEKQAFYAGLEIGSSKVALIVGRVTDNKLEIISAAQAPHKGMHQGQIVDAKEIASAIYKIKAEVELAADMPITSVHLTVADLSVETVHSKGVVSIKRSIGSRDIDIAMETALETAQIRSDREVLHNFAQFYKVAGVRYDEAPLRQKAASLEVHTTLVTCSKKNLQLGRECAAVAGFYVKGVIAHSVATAEALLLQADKEAGVAVIDIGGALTDIIAYQKGKMVFTTSVPVGGSNFTQDLAVGLRTPQAAAEKIKKNHGAALVDVVSAGEQVLIESLKGEPPHPVDARFVASILEARSEETLGLILKKLNDEDLLFSLKNGLYLTGGASQLPGLPELGEFTFDVVFKRGIAREILTSNPLAQGPGLSTAVGLLQYARDRQTFEPSEISVDTFKNSWGKIKNFIENIL